MLEIFIYFIRIEPYLLHILCDLKRINFQFSITLLIRIKRIESQFKTASVRFNLTLKVDLFQWNANKIQKEKAILRFYQNISF
jgi:hypothetical protein